MHLALTRTVFGRHLFQTGINEKAARVNGVNTLEDFVPDLHDCRRYDRNFNGVLTAAETEFCRADNGTGECF